MEDLKTISKSADLSLYQINNSSLVKSFIATTPETRSICNDPLVFGVEYTDKLEMACAKTLRALKTSLQMNIEESKTSVLNILRGGLNFGLRGALQKAFQWNSHSCAFISAQRARQTNNVEEWYITENAYQKVYLANPCSIVFADVVATGTSLEFALKELLKIVSEQKCELSQIIFFTIGGKRSEEILIQIDKVCRTNFKNYRGSLVVYFEGSFAVAEVDSKLSIKYTGTDLIRCNSILAPEFFQSQLENPSFPLERCTIYDAGSRAFFIPEYLEDVIDYWEKTSELSKEGMSYKSLLEERFPEILGQYESKNINLEAVCSEQLRKLKECRPT